MSTPSKSGEPDTMPPMTSHSPFENARLKPILRIAVRSAGDALIWFGKALLFFATVAIVSAAVALFATTLLGAVALIISGFLYLRYVPIRPSPMLYHHQ